MKELVNTSDSYISKTDIDILVTIFLKNEITRNNILHHFFKSMNNTITKEEFINKWSEEQREMLSYYNLYNEIMSKYLEKIRNQSKLEKFLNIIISEIYGLFSIPVESFCYFLEDYNRLLSRNTRKNNRAEVYDIKSRIWDNNATLVHCIIQKLSIKTILQKTSNTFPDSTEPETFGDVELLIKTFVEENDVKEKIRELKLQLKNIML